MVFKAILIVTIIAILMEDGSSIKKTEEEKREDKELAELVNKTLADEKKKEDEEQRQEDEKKKMKTQDEKKKTDSGSGTVVKKEDEASSSNVTCPIIRECESCPEIPSCPPCEKCPAVKDCPEGERCPPCKECGTCPPVKPCQPCGPCPSTNSTNQGSVSPPSCPEPASMGVPEAMAVGAVATLLVTGVAAAISLLLRYASPIETGFVFLASLILIWYLSSHHPEVARELGGRVVTLLREATNTLGHRIAEAIRHRDQVGFSIIPTSLD
jgi:hypothetical protein